jgi:hypothetical protein
VPNTDQPSVGIGGPATNTTGAAAHVERVYSLIMGGNSERKLVALSELVSGQMSGYGMELREWFGRPTSWEGILALWTTALAEYNVLLAANAPTAAAKITAGAAVAYNAWTLP